MAFHGFPPSPVHLTVPVQRVFFVLFKSMAQELRGLRVEPSTVSWTEVQALERTLRERERRDELLVGLHVRRNGFTVMKGTIKMCHPAQRSETGDRRACLALAHLTMIGKLDTPAGATVIGGQAPCG